MSETMRRPLLPTSWMCSCSAVIPADQSSCYVCKRPRPIIQQKVKISDSPTGEVDCGVARARER